MKLPAASGGVSSGIPPKQTRLRSMSFGAVRLAIHPSGKPQGILAEANKLTDSMQEASETQSWMEFCMACHYIEKSLFDELDQEYEGIISMINAMEKNAHKFCF